LKSIWGESSINKIVFEIYVIEDRVDDKVKKSEELITQFSIQIFILRDIQK